MGNNNDNSQVYYDEPINKEKRNDDNIPQAIKKARALEDSLYSYNQINEQLFYVQGKLLENYEDDFVYNENVIRYYPTYDRLSNDELRAYFSWRTKLRKGNIEKTSLSFAFLYIYELLNQIGTTDVSDGYHKLKNFKDEYTKLDSSVGMYINRWLNDYIIYNELDVALLANSKEVNYDNNLLVLIKHDNYKKDDIINSLNFLSSYKFINSPFYKKNKDLFEEVIISTFFKICTYYENHHRHDLFHDYFGYVEDRLVTLFMNCIFYRKGKFSDREYVIDEIRKYNYENGSWMVTGYSPYNIPCKRLGKLLKTIDAMARTKFNFSRSLKKEMALKWLDKIINDEIDVIISKKKETKVIEIDFSKLSTIRSDAEVTKNKLIIDEEQDELDEEINQQEDEDENNDTNLSDNEYHLLKCLLYDMDYTWVKNKGLLLSVLVDNINEKLFDYFNDTILTNDDKLKIIEDYIDDLKGMIKR